MSAPAPLTCLSERPETLVKHLPPGKLASLNFFPIPPQSTPEPDTTSPTAADRSHSHPVNALLSFIALFNRVFLQEVCLPATLLAPAVHTIGDVRQEREVVDLAVENFFQSSSFPQRLPRPPTQRSSSPQPHVDSG